MELSPMMAVTGPPLSGHALLGSDISTSTRESSPGGFAPPGPPREAPPACPPAHFVVAIGLSAQNDAEPPGRDLL
eukprot:12730923-Alexandrium_andersonii.AAC.1